MEFTASEAMHGKLEQLKAFLRHQVPNGDLATILERAADLLLEKTMKTRFAQTTRPRAESVRESTAMAARASDAASNAAHDIEEAGNRAAANDADRVQPHRAHHDETPYALGGAATAGNLRIVCRTRNALLAEREFGRAFMEAKLVHARLRMDDRAKDSS